jgi:hypothetical protein
VWTTSFVMFEDISVVVRAALVLAPSCTLTQLFVHALIFGLTLS